MKKTNTLYKQWQELQPLKAEDKKRLDQKFMLEFNYNSNHIEGNTLTYGQTKLLLMFGETTGSASLKDYEEMKAHNVGLEMIKQYAKDSERPLTESFIRELNKTILVKNYWIDAKTPDGQPTRMEVNVGEYKSRPNSVVTATGEVFEYAKPEETPALMTDLVRWFNEEVEKGELTALELASLFHYRYIRIHPFEDGNGRISRLLVNYILHKFDYSMIIIKSEDKANYLRALRQSDINCGLEPCAGANASVEQISPFVDYMMYQLDYALAICVRAAKGESIEEAEDWKKKLTLVMNEGNTTPPPPDIADEIYKTNILPLFDVIEREVTPFLPLFESSKIVVFEDGQFQNIRLKHNADKYAVNTKYTGYLNSYQIEVIYSHDIFGFSTIFKIIKNYDELLDKSDVQDIVNAVGNKLHQLQKQFRNDSK